MFFNVFYIIYLFNVLFIDFLYGLGLLFFNDFNPDYALDFIRKEIRQNSSETHELRKKLISEIPI